jgi:hypothetical protein
MYESHQHRQLNAVRAVTVRCSLGPAIPSHVRAIAANNPTSACLRQNVGQAAAPSYYKPSDVCQPQPQLYLTP